MRKKNIINLLGIQENLVKNIQRGQNFINIYVETKPKEHICPCCKSKTKHIHDYRTQKIQHISISHVASYIILKKRRYICHNCSKRFYEHYDFLQKNFRKSNTLFDNVVEDLKQLKNIKTIAKDNNISSPTVVRYMHFATVLEGKFNLVPLPEKIGIDEFKGNVNGTKYQFHVFDLDTHKTIEIIESRTYDVLETFFSKYTSEERKKVKIVSMDLYRPFKRIVKDKFINATIIADCFHFTRVVSKALDELRLNLWRKAKGNEKNYFKYLKHALLKDISKVTEKDSEKLLYAFDLSPILKYAYKLYQEFLQIKKLDGYEAKEKAFKKWIYEAEGSTIQELAKTTKTLREWHQYISNAFKFGLSNGPTEGKNNLIKTLKRISFGFKRLDNFRARILLLELN